MLIFFSSFFIIWKNRTSRMSDWSQNCLISDRKIRQKNVHWDFPNAYFSLTILTIDCSTGRDSFSRKIMSFSEVRTNRLRHPREDRYTGVGRLSLQPTTGNIAKSRYYKLSHLGCQIWNWNTGTWENLNRRKLRLKTKTYVNGIFFFFCLKIL